MGKYKGFAGSGMNANKNMSNVIKHWDGSVSRQYPDWTEEDFRRELDKWPAEKQRAVGEGTPADWALECARSCRVVYDWAKPGDDIDEGFLREHGALPVDQALRGAYRLARVLNDLFDN